MLPNVSAKVSNLLLCQMAGNPDTGSKCQPLGYGQVMGGPCVDAGGD